MQDLFSKLSEALDSGNKEEIDRVKRQILLSNRDEEIDRHFMESLKGKAIYKNIKKSIYSGEDISRLYCAKVISSIITHAIIESEKTGNSMGEYGVSEMYVVLGNLINGKIGAVNDFIEFVRDRYEKFIE